MEELLVVLGALITLVLSIAGMNIYRWRTDVLTGPYISNRDCQLTIPDKAMDGVSQAMAEERRTTHPFLRGWNSSPFVPEARRKPTGYSSNRATDLSRLRARLQPTLLAVKGFYSRKAVGRLTTGPGLTDRTAQAP
ncbi:MAG: hypothetical protein JWP25_4344 [Bradyrhizobium sp.]|jgi:hypothetical protein|nr:hypothetical protein [Bradyrhizobium sp.]